MQKSYAKDMEKLPGWICVRSKALSRWHEDEGKVAASYNQRVVTGNNPQALARYSEVHDAILNVSCPPGVLEMLIRDNQEALQSVLHQTDEEGLLPIDHLIMRLGSSSSFPPFQFAFKKLELLLPFYKLQKEHTNRLIRLLSMGECKYSENLLRFECTQQQWFRTLTQAVKLLLPDAHQLTGNMTDCTLLHVAIRNYGFCSPLVTTIMDHYHQTTIRDGLSVFRSRNIAGDLPLHLACRVGVPMETLTRILHHTLEADQLCASSHEDRSLICSVNNEGLTAVDLVWIHHLFNGPSLPSVGLCKSSKTLTNRRRDTYHGLLVMLVDQIVEDFKGSESDRPGCVRHLVGEAMLRSLILIRAMHAGTYKQPCFAAPVDDDFDCILHAAAAIGGPKNANLPYSLLRLLLWQYPDQAKKRDALGRLPLHYAADSTQNCTRNACNVAVGNDWLQWVEQLYYHHPMACLETDSIGRMPIHYALDSSLNRPHDGCIECDEVARNLVSKCPQSVEVLDPLSQLPPFMQAACNPSISLETAYGILRQSPGVLCSLSTNHICKDKS